MNRRNPDSAKNYWDLLCVRFCTKCFLTRTQPIGTEQIMAISTPVLSCSFLPTKFPSLYIFCIINCITICPVTQINKKKLGHLWLYSIPYKAYLIHSSRIISSLHFFHALVSPLVETSFSFPTLASFYLFFKFSSFVTLSLTFLVTI